jgi:peptidoglycan/LPS O-acetylase OafA/YrhL
MDSVRALACAAVIVWHAFLTVVPQAPSPGQALVALPLGAVAREAVVVFVVLSGYLLGRHWRGGFTRDDLGTTFRTYMLRRTWRMVPPYWAALVFAAAAILALGLGDPRGTHWDHSLPLTWERFAVDALMISDVVGQVPISHQLWTVPIEFHLYLAAPLIVLLRTRWAALALGSAATVAVAVSMPYFHAPYFVFAFVVAFWVGVRRQSVATRSPWSLAALLAPAAALSVILALVITVWGGLPQSTGRYFVLDAFVAPVFTWWIVVSDVTASRSWLIRLLDLRPLRWLGRLSYSHYLTHAVMIELTWRWVVEPVGWVSDSANIWAMIVLGYALSLVVAVGFYRAIELPSMRISRRIGAAKRRVGPPVHIGSDAP